MNSNSTSDIIRPIERLTEGRHCFTLPADTPKKNRNWPKSLLPPPPDFSIDKNDVDEFNSILLSEMYSWTKFYRLNVFEQEIFWLLELSAIFADGARARFRYIHSNMTEELASFLEEKDITSISLLVTQYFRKVHPENKIEFIAPKEYIKGNKTEYKGDRSCEDLEKFSNIKPKPLKKSKVKKTNSKVKKTNSKVNK